MDEKEQNKAIRAVMPPKSTLTTVLNGIGNGAMVGGLPLAGEVLLRTFFPQSKIPDWVHKAAIFTTVTGAAVGAVFSLKEAKQVDEYRAALVAELDELHAKVDAKSMAAAR